MPRRGNSLTHSLTHHSPTHSSTHCTHCTPPPQLPCSVGYRRVRREATARGCTIRTQGLQSSDGELPGVYHACPFKLSPPLILPSSPHPPLPPSSSSPLPIILLSAPPPLILLSAPPLPTGCSQGRLQQCSRPHWIRRSDGAGGCHTPG
jgi:hypothetical protein